MLNRGNGGAIVFHKDSDYAAFCEVLATANSKVPVQALGFCLMPNHFHLVVPPATDTGLSLFMQLVDDQSRPPLPSARPQPQPCVARALQEFFDPAR